GRVRRPRRAAMLGRGRRRWRLAAGIAAVWVLLYVMTRSAVATTVALLLVAIVVAVCVVALRALGINSSHPWVRQLASRPWRDGQDVLRLSLRHLPEVFVVTPSGRPPGPPPGCQSRGPPGRNRRRRQGRIRCGTGRATRFRSPMMGEPAAPRRGR